MVNKKCHSPSRIEDNLNPEQDILIEIQEKQAIIQAKNRQQHMVHKPDIIKLFNKFFGRSLFYVALPFSHFPNKRVVTVPQIYVFKTKFIVRK